MIDHIKFWLAKTLADFIAALFVLVLFFGSFFIYAAIQIWRKDRGKKRHNKVKP